MRLLLDTHVAVWAVMGDPRLGAPTADIISDPASDVFVSAVSLWEISIKFALARKRDPMPFSAREALVWFDQLRFQMLSVEARHAAAVDDLPGLHGDPFDRLLVAQAIDEPMRLVTHDRRLAAYSELVIVI